MSKKEQEMKVATKTFSTDLSIDSHRMIREIIKRTGETKVKLFDRLIKNEFEKGEQNFVIDVNYLSELKTVLEELKSENIKQFELVKLIRESMNKIYCSVLFLLKELFRTMHFIKGIFLQTSLLTPEKLTILNSKIDQETNESFKPAFKVLNDSKPIEIIDLLINKK